MVSFQVAEQVATANPSVFITGREFARVLLTTPTIYLTLPLSSAHWAIIRAWAQPHSASTSALVPHGTVVLSHRAMFTSWLSVDRCLILPFLAERESKELRRLEQPLFGADQYKEIEEELAVAI
jgi:hypothetical protein